MNKVDLKKKQVYKSSVY